MKNAIYLGLTIVVLSGVVGARQNYSVYGPGNNSCGQWIRNRRNFVAHGVETAWLLGFVSGVGWTGAPALKPTDSAGIELWVDRFCAERPTDSLIDATKVLVRELAQQR